MEKVRSYVFLIKPGFAWPALLMTMKVGIRFGVCNKPRANCLHCECARHPPIPHHHNSATYNKERATKPGKNGLKWLKMGEHG